MKCTGKIILFWLAFSSILFAQSDIPGSKDHPLITRYPGMVIEWTDVQNYDQYKIATGPVTGYRHIDDWLPVAGNVTRIYYSLAGTRSVTEVYFNYLKAIKKAGFEVLAKRVHKSRNVSKEIGGRGWLGVYFNENPYPTSKSISLLDGSATVGGSCFLAGKLSRKSGTVFVAISGTQYKDDRVLFMVDIIEQEAVEDDLIFVDANAMLSEIKANGKIALYGIYFDTGKATLKPESKPTLDEIAKLLKQNPEIALHVVGHTDSQGGFEMNMQLSRNRGAAVVKSLKQNYGIGKNRLVGHGVGPLCPAATNSSEKGRSKNRRVELVVK